MVVMAAERRAMIVRDAQVFLSTMGSDPSQAAPDGQLPLGL